jgi:transposase
LASERYHDQRLATIPGIGPITASALAATITDPDLFSSGRQLAAWLGLVPRQSSSGGKERLGRITKQGDPYIRRLLITGASAVLRYARQRSAAPSVAEYPLVRTTDKPVQRGRLLSLRKSKDELGLPRPIIGRR